MNWRAILERPDPHPQKEQYPQNSGDVVNFVDYVDIVGRDLPLNDRWNPELAGRGYVLCMDCQYFDGVNCNHTDNLFHTVTKCQRAPRKCQWYEE